MIVDLQGGTVKLADITPRKRSRGELPHQDNHLIQVIPCDIRGGNDTDLVGLGFLVGKKNRNTGWRSVVIPLAWSYKKVTDNSWIICDQLGRVRLEITFGDKLEGSLAKILTPLECAMKMISGNSQMIFDEWASKKELITEAQSIVNFIEDNWTPPTSQRDSALKLCKKFVELYRSDERKSTPSHVRSLIESARPDSVKLSIRIRSAELRDKLQDMGCWVDMPSSTTMKSEVTLPAGWLYLPTNNEYIPFAVIDSMRRIRIKFMSTNDGNWLDAHIVSVLEYAIDSLKKKREPIWDSEWATPNIVRQEAENALNYPYHTSAADHELVSLCGQLIRSFGG